MTFSICIPVYKNVQFLKRLLDSTLSQSFTDFEIVITDDSPDDSVQQWLKGSFNDSRIRYYRNAAPLGTPENWNEGIRRAKGEWIKLMHDDDWFDSSDALKIFLAATQSSNSKVFFSAYTNYFLNKQTKEQVNCPKMRWQMVKANPAALYARNIIGPPSVILVHRSVAEEYDNRLKWLVDIEFYIRLMQHYEFQYVPQPLVAVGVGNEQVTVGCHTVPEVEVPEGLLLYSKLHGSPRHNMLYFDAWWRIMRNLEIRSDEQFLSYSKGLPVPDFIWSIIRHQQRASTAKLRNGYLSKLMMSWCWISNL